MSLVEKSNEPRKTPTNGGGGKIQDDSISRSPLPPFTKCFRYLQNTKYKVEKVNKGTSSLYNVHVNVHCTSIALNRGFSRCFF